MGTIILSALVAHTAWHWMTDAPAILRQYRFEWPVLDALFWRGAMRWLMLVVVCAGLSWLVFGVFKPGMGKRRPDARGMPHSNWELRNSGVGE